MKLYLVWNHQSETIALTESFELALDLLVELATLGFLDTYGDEPKALIVIGPIGGEILND